MTRRGCSALVWLALAGCAEPSALVDAAGDGGPTLDASADVMSVDVGVLDAAPPVDASDCAVSCTAPGCTCPPLSWVRVTDPDGDESEILATEVTQSQYNAMLTAGARPDPTSPDCGWNASLQPGDALSTPDCRAYVLDPLGSADVPVACVDWCDARAFCAHVGGRLCGVTPLFVEADLADPRVDEWFNACSSAGVRPVYPYGDRYDGAACVGSDYDGVPLFQRATDVARVVAEATACRGTMAPFDGLYDLAGNVAEWTASCRSGLGPSSRCLVRGGSYRDGEGGAACSRSFEGPRGGRLEHLGFRCCR